MEDLFLLLLLEEKDGETRDSRGAASQEDFGDEMDRKLVLDQFEENE